MMFQQGNTVRLTVEFKDWNGAVVDPALIKFIVYDANFAKQNEWPIGINNRLDVGKYFFDYVPIQPGTFFYEWYAEIDGLPSLKRDRLEIRRV